MLTQRAGRIVNISSVSAHTGAGFSAVSKFAYCAAKAGVLGLTRGLAKELAPHVTVNAICPGMILTDLTTHMVAANTDTILRSIPLQRLGTPEDVAEVVAFLATVTPKKRSARAMRADTSRRGDAGAVYCAGSPSICSTLNTVYPLRKWMSRAISTPLSVSVSLLVR